MAARSVVEKLGIGAGMKAIFVDKPDAFPDEIDASVMSVSGKLTGEFDYIHVFVITQRALTKWFARLPGHVRKEGALWVSWPKAGQRNSDLTIKSVIRIGYDHNMVESKAISINAVWSALRFTHPKPGKTYCNSYGRLKS